MRFVFWMLLASACLFGEKEEDFTLDREAEPSAYVHGCVNALTGTLLQTDVDISVRGPAPLNITRFYNNKVNRFSSGYYFGIGHSLNHPIVISEIDYGKNTRVMVEEVGGSFLRFYSAGDNYFFLDPEMPKFGLTNGGGSNYKQIKMSASKTGKAKKCPWEVQLPDGTKRFYEDSRLIRQELPDGNKILYAYDSLQRPAHISTTDRTGTLVFGWIALQYAELNKYSSVTATSSDGRTVTYEIVKQITRFDGENNMQLAYTFPILSSVSGTSTPKVTYSYFKPGMNTVSHDLHKVERPDGRFLEFHMKGGKVTKIFSPYGNIYRFEYHDHTRENHVYDAYGKRTTYTYTPQLWLSEIKKWNNGSLYSTQSFEWLIGEPFVPKGAQPSDRNGFLVSKCLKAGNQVVHSTAFEYDERGNVTKETFSGNLTGQGFESHSLEKVYSEQNLPIIVTEEEGLCTEYTYLPGTNLVTSKINPFVQEHYTYDEHGFLVQKTIEDDISTKITSITPCYANGQPHIVQESDKKTVYHYDQYHLPAQVDLYDANNTYCGSTFSHFDSHHNLTDFTDPLGRKVSYQYDANDNKIFEENPSCTIFYTYDLCNRLLSKKEVYPDGTFTTHFSYDKMGRKLSQTDPYGQTTKYLYDDLGREIAIEYPDHTRELKEYTVTNEISCFTNREGHKTYKEYNAYGKPTYILYPDGSEERFVYTKKGQLHKKWEKNGLCLTYTYDAFGHVIREEGEGIQTFEYIGDHLIRSYDKMGNCTEYAYDKTGRKIGQTKCGIQKTEYAYDTLGRLHKTIKDATVEVKEYDVVGRVIEERIEDRSGTLFEKKRFGYDVNDNKIWIEEWFSPTTSCMTTFQYNGRKELVQKVDGLGNKTTLDYDHFFINEKGKQVLKKTTTDPLGNKIIEIFNIEKKVVSKETQNIKGERTSLTEFAYNALGQETSQTHHVLENSIEKRLYTIQSTYDSTGKIIQLNEMGKITTYTYDASGKLSILTKPDQTKLAHTYDKLGRLQTLTSSDNTIDYTYAYDLNNHLLSVLDHTIPTSAYSYDALGNLIWERLANGLELSFAYDAHSRLTQLFLQDQSPITYIYDGPDLKRIQKGSYIFEYKRDLTGAPLQEVSPAGTTSYTYDLLGRPLSIASQHYSETVSYDPAGNLISKKFSDPIGHEQDSFAYDDLYQLISEEDHTYTYDSINNRLHKDDTPYSLNALNQIESFTYDLNGNLLSDGNNLYTYDALNRLIQANETHYTYDSSGRRMTKNNERFLYLNSCEIGTETTQRILGTGRGADVKASVAIETPTGTYIPIHDTRGNIVLLLSLSGAPIETLRYTAFGETTLYGPDLTPWQYASKRLDPETGLFLFTHRYYNPTLGRFLTCDPTGFSDGPNLYAFVHNSPLVLFDPYGLFAFSNLNYSSPFAHIQNQNFIPQVYHFNNFESVHPHQNKSFVSTTTQGRDHDKIGIFFTNGIQNTPEDYNKSLNMVAKMTHGINVTGVYNGSKDFLTDLYECHLGLKHVATEPTDLIVKAWMHLFEIKGPDFQLLSIGHSQGVPNLLNATLQMPEELRKRIHIRAFAPATYVSRNLCASVAHYRAADWWRDFVPRIDFNGSQMAEREGTIKNLAAPLSAGLWVHSFDNSIYRKPMVDEIDRFINTYGK